MSQPLSPIARWGDSAVRIERAYRQMLTWAAGQALDGTDEGMAACAFYQAGVYRHRLMVLRDVVDRFHREKHQGDPIPAFYDHLSTLAEPDLAAGAERCYRVALALAPGFAEARYNLAVIRQRRGALEEALLLFERAARGQPHARARAHSRLAANAWWVSAEILTRLGRPDDAEAAYMKALALLGNFGVYHTAAADFLIRRRPGITAAEHYERVMPYSHLHAQEFLEPDFLPAETVPVDPAGRPCDPLVPSMVAWCAGGVIYYWLHLYCLVPGSLGPVTARDLETALGSRANPTRWSSRRWTLRNLRVALARETLLS